jgi:GxxExxY protein
MKTETALANKIVGFAMKVHRKLGPGFSERVNQNALVVECSRAGLEVEAFKEIKVLYEGVTVGEFVADMVVKDAAAGEELLIENKAVSMLIKSHSYQLVNYLNATETDHGLLINCGGDSLEFRTKTRRYRKPEVDVDLTA